MVQARDKRSEGKECKGEAGRAGLVQFKAFGSSGVSRRAVNNLCLARSTAWWWVGVLHASIA
jgi:hypothetical protein